MNVGRKVKKISSRLLLLCFYTFNDGKLGLFIQHLSGSKMLHSIRSIATNNKSKKYNTKHTNVKTHLNRGRKELVCA